MKALLVKTLMWPGMVVNHWWVLAIIAPLLSLAGYYGILAAEKRAVGQFPKYDPLLILVLAVLLALGAHAFVWPHLDHWATGARTALLETGTVKPVQVLVLRFKIIGANVASLLAGGLFVGIVTAGARVGQSKPMQKPKEIEKGTEIIDGAPFQRATAARLAKVKQHLEGTATNVR